MKNDVVYLRHILESIECIEQFLTDKNEEEFLADNLVSSAVIRHLEIIGEAVKNLSLKLRKQYSHIPWKDIAGLRDKLIHVYFGVDLALIWGICQKGVPELKHVIKEIMKG